MEAQTTQEHLTPFKTYFIVWVMLLILTGLTLGVAYLDFGEISTIISILVASSKAILVLLYFMNLRHEGKMTKYTFVVSAVILAIFIIGVYVDIIFLMRN